MPDTSPPVETLRLYVGNIPYAYQRKHLVALFEPFGPVLFIKMPISISDSPTQLNRGFAFVDLAKDHAMLAIEKLNGTPDPLAGRKLNVSPALADDSKFER